MVWGGVWRNGRTDVMTGLHYRDQNLSVYTRPYAGAVGQWMITAVLIGLVVVGKQVPGAGDRGLACAISGLKSDRTCVKHSVDGHFRPYGTIVDSRRAQECSC